MHQPMDVQPEPNPEHGDHAAVQAAESARLTHESPAGHDLHAEHAGHDMHAEHAGHDMHAEHAGHDMHAEHAGHAMHCEHAGHEAAHADHTGHEQMFRRKFWISLVLSIPVILFSPSIQALLGFSMPVFPWQPMDQPGFWRDRLFVRRHPLPADGRA